MGTVKQDFFIILPFDQDRQRTWLPGALPFGFYFGGRAVAHMGAALHYFCRAGPVCPAGAVGRATARVAPTQKFVLGRHTQKFLLTPGGKSDTLNAIQAMMGVAARSCGRKCPPDGTVMAVECGVFRIQVEPRTMILVRPELRRQFRAFFY